MHSRRRCKCCSLLRWAPGPAPGRRPAGASAGRSHCQARWRALRGAARARSAAAASARSARRGTTPDVWTAAQLKAGASYGAWKAPIAGYACKTSSSGVYGGDVAACKRRCSAADCAGIIYSTGKYCYICSDASKGSASSSYTIHPRTPIGAKTVAQCSACDKSFYAKGSVCTACPSGSSHSKVGSTSITDCRSSCAANQYLSSAKCTTCPSGSTNAATTSYSFSA